MDDDNRRTDDDRWRWWGSNYNGPVTVMIASAFLNQTAGGHEERGKAGKKKNHFGDLHGRYVHELN